MQALNEKQKAHRKKELAKRCPTRLVMALAGSPRNYVILRELVDWWPYAKFHQDGLFWVVKSYKELMDECALPRHAVARSLHALEASGVIQRRREKFFGGSVHVCITFTEVAHQALWGDFYEIPGWVPEVVSGGTS